MPTVKDFVAAGREYVSQVAGNNPVITQKPVSKWLDDIAAKQEHDQFMEFIQKKTVEYNLSLLDGEEPISEREMALIMEEKLGKHYCSLQPAGRDIMLTERMIHDIRSALMCRFNQDYVLKIMQLIRKANDRSQGIAPEGTLFKDDPRTRVRLGG